MGRVTPARRRARCLGLLCLAGTLAAPAGQAGASAPDPGPGSVSVLDQAGAPIGPPLSGPDAVEDAVLRVHDGPLARADDTVPWSIVIGDGSYGDVAIDEPDLLLRPSAGATVALSGAGGASNTNGGCIDVFRGGVEIDGLQCRAPSAYGVQVSVAPGKGGVTLRRLGVDRSGTTGIAVVQADAVTIDGATVSDAGTDGIRFSAVAGPGPYLVTDTQVRGSGDDGIDLAGAAERVTVRRTVAQGNRDNGIEADDRPVDTTVSGDTLTDNAGDGARLGGGTRVAVTDTTAAGNGAAGLELLAGNAYVLRGDRLGATNRRGDLQFSADLRSGGVYEGLTIGGAILSLPGEPRSVVLAGAGAAQLSSGSPLPVGLAEVGGFVRVRAVRPFASSGVTVSFQVGAARLAAFRPGALQVYEDVRHGSRVGWVPVPGGRIDPSGSIEVTIGQGRIGGTSPAGFSTYGPLGTRLGTPILTDLLPAPGATVIGRSFAVRARVLASGPLTSRSLTLWLDGRPRGGIRLARGGLVIARVPRATLGHHLARLRVVGASGLAALREWSFQVRNAPPAVRVSGARPRPGASVGRSASIAISIPARDDEPVRRGRVRLIVDGRRVPVSVSGGRVRAVGVLAPGIHHVSISVRDRNGASAHGNWSFRIV